MPLRLSARVSIEPPARPVDTAHDLLCAVPVDVDEMGIDLMSISGHKIYGPKGIGACYVRRRPRVRIEPIMSGGGQERGLRSGTVPAPLVVGFGEACRLAKHEMAVSTVLSRFSLIHDGSEGTTTSRHLCDDSFPLQVFIDLERDFSRRR